MFCFGKKQTSPNPSVESRCFEVLSQMTLEIESYVSKHNDYPEFIVLEVWQIKVLKKYFNSFKFFREQEKESPLMFNGVKILADPKGIFAYD